MNIEDKLYWYKAKITSLYDGDSLTVDLSLGCFMYKFPQKIRLLGIDAPEVRGEEREQGLISRDKLREKLPIGTSVVVNTQLDKDDKYGRLLATIYLDGVNINSWMIEQGFAKSYM